MKDWILVHERTATRPIFVTISSLNNMGEEMTPCIISVEVGSRGVNRLMPEIEIRSASLHEIENDSI